MLNVLFLSTVDGKLKMILAEVLQPDSTVGVSQGENGESVT